MSDAFLAPREMVAKKAKHGEACTRCGLCCIAELCPLAIHVLDAPRDATGPCPFLTFDAAGSRCGLADLPGEQGLAASFLIGSGNGCDALLQGEKSDPEFYKKLPDIKRRSKPQARRALQIWGFTERGES